MGSRLVGHSVLKTLFFGAVVLLSGCRESTFDSAFDPRLFKGTTTKWGFQNSNDYQFDSSKIEVVGDSARLKLIESQHVATDFAAGTHRGTIVSGGNLTLDPATTLHSELDGAWVPSAANLKAYWKFNGDATTSIGANALTLNGTPTFSKDRKLGSHSVKLNGTTDFYSVTREKDYGLLSVSAWVKIESFPQSSAPLFFRMNGQTWYPRLRVSNTGAVTLQYRLGGGTTSVTSTLTPVKVGVWHHIAATLSPAGGAKIYVDGILVGQNLTTGTVISGGANQMLIGRDSDIGTYLDGKIDEAGIWDVILSDADIRTIYLRQAARYSGEFLSPVFDAGGVKSWSQFFARTPIPFFKELPGSAASEAAGSYSDLTTNLGQNLVAYWPFEDTALDSASGGADIEDVSGHNHPLTETGGVTLGQVGKLNRSVRLDGVNDSLSVPLDLSGTNAVTISAWIKFHSTSGTPLGFEFTSNFNAINSRGFIFLPYETGGSISGYASIGWRGNTGYNVKGFDRTLIEVGKFHHYVFIFDSSQPAAQEVRVFLDGKEITTFYSTGALQNDNTSNFANATLFIGSRNNASLRANAEYDEFAVWSRRLSDVEAQQMYRRGANRLKYQVRSCDDPACDTETWMGPSGNTSTTFSELLNYSAIDANGVGSGSVLASPLSLQLADFSPSGLTVTPNRYFQYRVLMESDDQNSLCGGLPCLPQLTSVRAGPAHYDGTSPSITNKVGMNYSAIQSLNFGTAGSCQPRYQLSGNGTDFYFWNGTGWAATTNGVSDSSLGVDIQANALTFARTAGAGRFFFRAYLPSDTTQACQLNSVELGYE